MAQTLRPCPSCGRHVDSTEGRCPFCAAAMPDGFGDFAYPTVSKRMSRAAIAAFGASLALAGCASSTNPTDGGSDVTQADTSSPSDGASDGATTQDVMVTPDVPVAAYGLPPQDAGVAPPYGIPPRDE